MQPRVTIAALAAGLMAFVSGPGARAEPLAGAAAALAGAVAARVEAIAAAAAPTALEVKEGKTLSKAAALLGRYGGGATAADLALLVKAVQSAVKSRTSDGAVVDAVEDLVECAVELARSQAEIVELALEQLRSPKFRDKVDRLLDKAGVTFDQALARILADPAGAAKLLVKAIFSARKSEALALKLIAAEAGGEPPPCVPSQGSMTATVDGAPFVADGVYAVVQRVAATGEITFVSIQGGAGPEQARRTFNFDFLAAEISFRGADTYALGPVLGDGSANWLRAYYREPGLPGFDAKSGTLVIDVFDLAAGRIAGSFAMTGDNTHSTREIGDGLFDIACVNVQSLGAP